MFDIPAHQTLVSESWHGTDEVQYSARTGMQLRMQIRYAGPRQGRQAAGTLEMRMCHG